MGLVVLPIRTNYKLSSLRLNYGCSLVRDLTGLILPQYSYTERDFFTGVRTTVGSTLPETLHSSKFGFGWRNNATNNKNIVTNSTSGYSKGLTFYTVAILAKIFVTPGSGLTHAYYMETTASSASASRLQIYLANNVLGATGIKWSVSFRTGTAASTRRDVNAGAGGTAIVAGREDIVLFTFDATADLYTLYLNGYQEGQLSVAESAIADTNPGASPTFLTQSDGLAPANGSIHGFFFWNRVLSAAEIADFSMNPFLIFTPGNRRLVPNQSITLNTYISSKAKSQLTVIRPVNDVSIGAWGVSPLFSKINEVSPNDANYVLSSTSPVSDTFEVSLTPTGTPINRTTHNVRYRLLKNGTGQQINMTVGLYQGPTLISSGIHNDIPSYTFLTGFSLTTGEASSITDYTDLRLRFTANTV